MPIFFAFSDESGGYRTDRTERYLEKHPYYVRATYVIEAEEWKKLNNDFLLLKDRYNLPRDKEVKWSYIWSLRSHQQYKKVVPASKPYHFLSEIDYFTLLEFVDNALSLLNRLTKKFAIITFTDNRHVDRISELNIFKMHLQEVMQRIEMEVQAWDENNLCVLFVDPISQQKDAYFKDVYHELFAHGDFIKDYAHIKDSLVVENSHQSVGIQLADFVAGSFYGLLKGYEQSKLIFNNNIRNKLRNKDGSVWGYGLREVPKNSDVRECFMKIVG